MENKELVKLMSDMMDSKLNTMRNELSDMMDNKLISIKDELKEVNRRLDKLECKQEIIYEEVARTREDITEIKQNIEGINKNMDFVETATIKNLSDIQSLKSMRS